MDPAALQSTFISGLPTGSSLPRSAAMSWTAIHAQFGAGFRLVRQIKPTFIEALTLALAVYPEARVDAEKERNHASSFSSPPYFTPKLGNSSIS